jgi:signal transduction histidine kinase
MPNDQYHEVLTVIITGIIIFVILTGVVVFILLFYQKKRFQHIQKIAELEKQYQEQLLQSQIETREHTFNQISEELHDNVGQLLSSTKMLLNATLLESKNLPESITMAEETISKAIQDLRSLSKSLNEEWLHQFNLVQNLEAEKNRINAARNIDVQFSSQFDQLPLEPGAQVMLFRVVQEALQNCIKHASPKNISIQIKRVDNSLELIICDDGSGFNIQSVKKQSLGLRNMEHRTKV